MRSIGGSSARLLLKLLLIYGSVFVSSSLRLPRSVHVNLPWGNLSPPSLLPCSGLLSRQRLMHSTWRYFAGAVLIWYTASRLLQHVTACYSMLQHVTACYSKPCYTSRFRFTALSSSSFLILLLIPIFLLLLFLLLSRGLPPRMHIKLPWGDLYVADGLAEGNSINNGQSWSRCSLDASRSKQRLVDLSTTSASNPFVAQPEFPQPRHMACPTHLEAICLGDLDAKAPKNVAPQQSNAWLNGGSVSAQVPTSAATIVSGSAPCTLVDPKQLNLQPQHSVL